MKLKLSGVEYDVLRVWVLGGLDAVGRHSTRTIDSLLTKGCVDRDGPTDEAKAYINAKEIESLTKKE